jgi:NAD(P)-dependent dehydrogenase (short-subunit alcohol dehydrogenase family)
MSEMVLKGKIAIVTGASSGIGKATAVRFAREGATVVLVARSEVSIQSLANELQEKGCRAMAVAGDLSDPAFPQQVVDAAVKEFGRVDCLVNSAGIISTGSIKDTSFADWNALMTLNLNSVFLLTQACVPHLVASKGSIVNVSSVTGLRSFPGRLGYCVSKAAVDQLTRCAALELAADGVRVNAVNPGVVVTNLQRQSGMDEASYAQWLDKSAPAHPLGRVGTADEVAELILFLASTKAGWITGVTYSIDGGRAQTCQ